GGPRGEEGRRSPAPHARVGSGPSDFVLVLVLVLGHRGDASWVPSTSTSTSTREAGPGSLPQLPPVDPPAAARLEPHQRLALLGGGGQRQVVEVVDPPEETAGVGRVGEAEAAHVQ